MVSLDKYYGVIKKPLLTEKTSNLQENRNQYTFKVASNTNKSEVKKAIEAIFEVKVERVNIATMPSKLKRFLGRPGRTSPWKKAVVTLKEGETIDLT